MFPHRKDLLAGLCILSTLFAVTILGFQGFHDDTGETCLSDVDPFCGGGGGGSDDDHGDFCWSCTMGEGDTDFRCREGSSGRECSEVFDSHGNYSCRITGPLCI